MSLEGKTALVTGASRGIGRQVALTLAKKGATVIVNYNGSQARAEEVVKEIIENGGKAAVCGCDVSDFSKAEDMIKNMTNIVKIIFTESIRNSRMLSQSIKLSYL